MLLQLRAMGQMACVEGLRRSNDRSAQYGLTLTGPRSRPWSGGGRRPLAEAGRVEFGEGALPQLIAAFCDSPTCARPTTRKPWRSFWCCSITLKRGAGTGSATEK